MRSKLKCRTLAAVLVIMAGCESDRNPTSVDTAAVDVLAFGTLPDIEARIAHTETHILDTFNSRFVFLTSPPLRGIPSTSVYCYEQIKSDKWILRCYLPIIIWNFSDSSSSSQISYRADSNAVEVLGNGMTLYSIKSVRDVPQRPSM
ncbi:MAG: hypothetical protein J0M24_26325 [Verrucomicrobia bacterium]|nr:hypothetical protein [Verrucomicrobiota bacterium]